METVNFSQGSSVFSIESIWKDPGPISRKYRAFLTPDSDAYISSINPIFSFELEDYSLNYFKTLSLRDGVYPLLRFFAMNPTPHHADSKLIVDSTFADLVPLSWRTKVYLRDLYVEGQTESNECLLLISPDRDSQPLDLFEKELLRIKDKNFQKISVYFSSCILKGEEENYNQSNWGYTLLKSIMVILKDSVIEILDWHQYQKKNVTGCAFEIINPLKLYFSDSFLTHDLLQRGAKPAYNLGVDLQNGHQEKISIDHGFIISPWKGTSESIFDKEFNQFFVHKSINVKPAWDDYLFVKLTTSEFKDFAIHTAKYLRK